MDAPKSRGSGDVALDEGTSAGGLPAHLPTDSHQDIHLILRRLVRRAVSVESGDSRMVPVCITDFRREPQTTEAKLDAPPDDETMVRFPVCALVGMAKGGDVRQQVDRYTVDVGGSTEYAGRITRFNVWLDEGKRQFVLEQQRELPRIGALASEATSGKIGEGGPVSFAAIERIELHPQPQRKPEIKRRANDVAFRLACSGSGNVIRGASTASYADRKGLAEAKTTTYKE
jgi:hypothetical protein